ncbi:MAG: hypothetical protein FDZ75_04250 [Actinobacteria bacterium]|nr:MAG: hypothetical protein FDZ75_04250 [Actinomycetota bacterium]
MQSNKRPADELLYGGIFVGALTLVAAALIALPTPAASRAFAAEQPVSPGVIGIGDYTSAPLVEPVTAETKVPDAATAAVVPAVMTRSIARTTGAASASVTPKVAVKTAPAKAVVRKTVKKQVVKKASSGWKKCKVSWYGPGFYGHGMAGGGKLTPTSMVLAHRTLPFGTKVAIKYHGKTVIGVVMDRGPYVRGREFDLGPGIAKKLGFSGWGYIDYMIVR